MRRMTILLAAMAALLLVPAAQAFALGTITIGAEGNGSGEVVGINGFGGTPNLACKYSPPGSVTGTCSTELSGEPGFEGIEMEAVPAAGSEFGGWVKEDPSFEAITTGSCPNISEYPKKTLTTYCGAYEVEEEEPAWQATAIFCTEGTASWEYEVHNNSPRFKFEGCEEASGPELTVTKEGGEGTIASNPAGIECGGKCSASFTEGSKVTLTASPASGYMFSSWKGCDKGGAIGRQCTVTMSAAKAVVAKFIPSYSVSVTKAGSGLGKVQLPRAASCAWSTAHPTARNSKAEPR